MDRQIRWAAVLASAVVCVAGIGLSGPAAGAEPPPTSDLRTVVYDSDGKPLAGATVVVTALPTRGRQGNLVFEELGIGRTNADGSVSIAVDTSNLSRFLEADGSVDLRVSAQNADGSQSSAFSHSVSVSSTSPTGRTTSAAATSVDTSFGTVSLNLSEGKSGPLLARQSGDGASTQAVTAAALPFRACRTSGGQEIESLVATSYYSSRWLAVGRVETRANSTMRYAWNTSNNTKFTVAYNGTYGGKVSSASQETSAGYNAPFPNNSNRHIEVHWQYRQYDVRCYNPEIGQFVADTGKDEHRPWKWADGIGGGSALSGTQFTCNGSHQTSIGSGISVWVTKSTTTEWSNGATIAGVSLRQNQTNSSTHKLTITADNGVTAKICGDTDYPSGAKRVKEVS